jgi:polysaccharide biosynthesis/export protein
MQMKSSRLVWVALPLAAALLTACASEPKGPVLDREAIVALNGSASAPYRLMAGDRIAVRFVYNETLDDEVTIPPDGRLSLRLVGEVQAAGLTPPELGRTLTQAYAASLGTESDRYVLGIGERLSIKSYYYERLNEDVVVRPDGKISLQLIDEIQAAGLTPSQLRSAINKRFAQYLDVPDVSVIVRDFKRPEVTVSLREASGQRVYIGGEVRQPGVLPLQTGATLLAAALHAGGPLKSARLDNVALLRHETQQAPALYFINLRAILQGQTPDVALRPLDVIYVPQTGAAETATFLTQNIYNLIPPQFLFTLGYELNNDVSIKTR